MTTAEIKICQHCKTRKVTRPRGLCWRCFKTPEIRRIYTAGSPGGHRGSAVNGGVMRDPEYATGAWPGSEEKIAVLASRAARGERLFHPEDRRL